MKTGFYQLLTTILLLCISAVAHGQIINTVAGNGIAGYSSDGVAATASKLNTPYGVAADGAGNFYISDNANHRIRKVNAAGVITTIAGNGMGAFSGDGGPATAARIFYPIGIAVDGAGNIYFSDLGNNRIRKITASTGIITTIAGNGTAGFSGDGGPATAAKMDNVWGVAIDGAGNVYAADQMNNRIRKITPAGIISTFAGTGVPAFSGDGGQATAARLNTPLGVAADVAGNVYVADYANNRVRKINAAGIISTIAGVGLPFGYAGDGGPATAALLYYPKGIAVDVPGNVYICDWNNSAIRKINTSGIISTIAGVDTAGFSGDGGPAIHAKLDGMTGVAVSNTGEVYISDNNNNRIRQIQTYKPSFSNGHLQSVIFCPVELYVLDTLLRVNDSDVGQTETWSMAQAPAHGTLVASYSTTSTGGTIMPSGLTYAPAFGYYGYDSFKVRVFDGAHYDTTAIYVALVAPPDAGVITGIDSVCPGHTRTLADTSAGGTWTSSNPAIATVSAAGVVTGVDTGNVSITYTVTNLCGTVRAYHSFRVSAAMPCISGTPQLTDPGYSLNIIPNPGYGDFELSITAATSATARVIITDVAGRNVMELTVPVNRKKKIKLDQPAGIYFITAGTGDWYSSSRITIIK